jgi:signal transduction histidine kinase
MPEQNPQSEANLAKIIGGLIHEIRNPLSTLSMNLQLLAEDFEGADDAKSRRAGRRIETLLAETKRLEILLSDFLKYLKGAKPQLTPVDLNALIGEIAEFIRPEAEKKGITVRTALGVGRPVVQADANLLRQAILNLTLNGCDAMSEGGELALETEAINGAAVACISDTGCGIPPEVLPKIFEPFYSTKPDGTGLGLSVARRIIHAHGGGIEIESEFGKGTRVRLTLPA